MPWDKGIIEHFFYQHTFNIAWTPGRKKGLFSLDPRKARDDWCKEMLGKYDGGASNDVYNVVTGDESLMYAYEPITKQQSTEWVFDDEPNPTIVVRGRSTSKQMIACFFGKAMWRLFHLSNVERTILSATPQLLWSNSKNEQDESLLTMAMWVLAHQLKSANIKKILRGQRFSPNNNFC